MIESILYRVSELSKERTLTERLRTLFFGSIGHIVILLQSTPFIWAGLMTFPLIGVLIVLFGGGLTPDISAWILSLFASPTVSTIIFDLGLILWIYSVFFLYWKKRGGLVTSGIYKYVRHPQYLGVILFTSTLTASSWWILAHTRGISYISKEETILVWFVMVLGYVGLAFAEEYYLVKERGDEYYSYQNQTALIVPFAKTKHRVLDTVVVLIFSGVLLLVQVMTLTPSVFI